MAQVSTFILVLISLLTSIFIYGQKENPIIFRVTCAGGAQTSPEIMSFKSISNLQDSSFIKKKLYNGSLLEQVLAAIILKHYDSYNQIELTQTEIIKIKQISKSKSRYSLCFTCTFHQEGKIKQMFNRKKYAISLYILEEYLLHKY